MADKIVLCPNNDMHPIDVVEMICTYSGAELVSIDEDEYWGLTPA